VPILVACRLMRNFPAIERITASDSHIVVASQSICCRFFCTIISSVHSDTTLLARLFLNRYNFTCSGNSCYLPDRRPRARNFAIHHDRHNFAFVSVRRRSRKSSGVSSVVERHWPVREGSGAESYSIQFMPPFRRDETFSVRQLFACVAPLDAFGVPLPIIQAYMRYSR
jgi:hypothetical protein